MANLTVSNNIIDAKYKQYNKTLNRAKNIASTIVVGTTGAVIGANAINAENVIKNESGFTAKIFGGAADLVLKGAKSAVDFVNKKIATPNIKDIVEKAQNAPKQTKALAAIGVLTGVAVLNAAHTLGKIKGIITTTKATYNILEKTEKETSEILAKYNK